MVRSSLLYYNAFLQFGSIAVLAVGIWTVSDKSFMEVLLRNSLFMSTAYIMIVTGCLAFVLSFLGCYGALKVTCLFQAGLSNLVFGSMNTLYDNLNGKTSALQDQSKNTLTWPSSNPKTPNRGATAQKGVVKRCQKCCQILNLLSFNVYYLVCLKLSKKGSMNQNRLKSMALNTWTGKIY